MIVRTLSAHVTPGTDVKRAQILLRNLGYLPHKHKSGLVYGLPTRRGVKAFKKDHHLPADGVLGEHGWVALERAYSKHTGHKYQAPVIAKPAPLRERAYQVAAGLVGVMEQGGNNMGPMVSKIIRENGGTGPESWCGDGMAYCYRHAGSKRVSRSWCAVRLLRGLLGVYATSKPKRGDLVRFDFSTSGLDHVGMFVRDLGNGEIETIEFNTGASGAVSDSTTGGDGVYRKHRAKSLVHDYLHVAG